MSHPGPTYCSLMLEEVADPSVERSEHEATSQLEQTRHDEALAQRYVAFRNSNSPTIDMGSTHRLQAEFDLADRVAAESTPAFDQRSSESTPAFDQRSSMGYPARTGTSLLRPLYPPPELPLVCQLHVVVTEVIFILPCIFCSIILSRHSLSSSMCMVCRHVGEKPA